MSKYFGSRISRIEKQLGSIEKAPVKIVCICNLDPKALEKRNRAAEEYFLKYGCYDGLIIVRSNIPEPRPVPEGFQTATRQVMHRKR